MTLAAATMVGLGFWQLDRYHTRTDINNRIDNATATPPTALANKLAPPSPARPGFVGPAPSADVLWAMVIATGRYDTSHEILARSRSVDSEVGFEILTPLVMNDGTAVLVDRGWLAPSEQGAAEAPKIPAAPTGDVTVVGRIHAPESRADNAEPYANALSVRHIAPQSLAPSIPLPLYGAYVTLETQTPAADPAFVPIPPDHQDAAMNAGYVAQWWMFALITLFGFGYLAYREGHEAPGSDAKDPDRKRRRDWRSELDDDTATERDWDLASDDDRDRDQAVSPSVASAT
jgi:cytochrome oxidase assembly protein ShyY1